MALALLALGLGACSDDEKKPAGFHDVTWDGKNNSGTPVPSGVYFYAIHAGRFKTSKRMVMLK